MDDLPRLSTLGKLRRGRRRLICRIIGHDWGGWSRPRHALAMHVGDDQVRPG